MRRARIGSVAALAGALLPAAAFGQTGALPLTQNLDVQAFRPAPGPGNLLTVEGARVDGHLAAFVGAWANYAYRPITLYTADCPSVTNDIGCQIGSVRSRPVESLFTVNVQAGFSLWGRLQLSIDLPFSVEAGQSIDINTAMPVQDAAGPRSQTSGALADPRIEGKVRLAGGGLRGPGVAVAVYGTLPVGRYAGGADRFLGDSSVTLGGRVIGDFRAGPITLAANLGFLWRPDTLQLLSTSVGSRFQWGVGGAWQFSPRVGAVAEVFGSTDTSAFFQDNSVEADLALRYTLSDVTLTAGAGPGLVRGVTAPVVRGFLGVVWAPYRVDSDHDGVMDNVDRCPDEPEDRDGFQDEDGCPDPDNDGDGIPDTADRCPNAPEDIDGFEDTDGCPDPDNDHDGILDAQDQCSEEPETVNGFQDEDGCPDTLPDRDHDGIPDARDRCPDQPETYNGIEDEDGCPEHGPVLADIVGGQIQILRAVNFGNASDRILGGESFRVLDSVTAILRAHPEIRAVEVQGHTDDHGSAEANRVLSQRRATAVRAYLVDHGIAAGRVTARGFGPDHPIESNTSPAGRAHNRRVEFHIVSPVAATAASAPAAGAPPAVAPAATAVTPPPSSPSPPPSQPLSPPR